MFEILYHQDNYKAKMASYVPPGRGTISPPTVFPRVLILPQFEKHGFDQSRFYPWINPRRLTVALVWTKYLRVA